MQGEKTLKCKAAFLIKRLCLRIDGCMTWLLDFLLELYDLAGCQHRGQEYELKSSFSTLGGAFSEALIVSNKSISADQRFNVTILTLACVAKLFISEAREDLFEQLEMFMLKNY